MLGWGSSAVEKLDQQIRLARLDPDHAINTDQAIRAAARCYHVRAEKADLLDINVVIELISLSQINHACDRLQPGWLGRC